MPDQAAGAFQLPGVTVPFHTADPGSFWPQARRSRLRKASRMLWVGSGTSTGLNIVSEFLPPQLRSPKL